MVGRPEKKHSVPGERALEFGIYGVPALSLKTMLPPVLLAAARRQLLAHAYLFVGSTPSAFKKATAVLAQTLNCRAEKPDQRPCGRCNVCQRIALGVHPDLHMLVPQGPNVRIDEVRGLLRDLRLKAVEGPWRVFLMEGAERLTVEAANTMLKMLEEPPANTAIILTSPAAEELLPTIVSRCQQISFGMPPEDEVVAALTVEKDKDQPIAPSTARFLARLTGHHVEKARVLFEKNEILALRDDVLKMVEGIIGGNFLAALDAAQKLSSDKDSLEIKLLLLDSIWRDLSLLQAGGLQEHLYNVDLADRLMSLHKNWVTSKKVHAQGVGFGNGLLESLLNTTAELRYALSTNVGRQLACDVACLRLASLVGEVEN